MFHFLPEPSCAATSIVYLIKQPYFEQKLYLYMKSRSHLVAVIALFTASLTLSSCFGRFYRASVANDRIKKQNGTYHRKHYHGNHMWY